MKKDKRFYTFKMDLQKRLKNPKFKKAWQEATHALEAKFVLSIK